MICDFLFFINFTKLLQNCYKFKKKGSEQSPCIFDSDIICSFIFKITSHNKTITIKEVK